MLDWLPLLPGTALWALALYLPLSLPLGRFEQALAVGAITNLVLGWILGPGWGTSMGLIAVLAGLVLALGGRGEDR